MSLMDIFRKKKEVKEPERNPYWNCDRVILNNNIDHQGIAGKTAYIERTISVEDIVEMALNHNIAALNFVRRRPDLFRNFEDVHIPQDMLIKRKAKYKRMKYYYVKIWQSDDRNGAYLGYFIASDEYSEYMKAKGLEEETRWI